MPKVEEIIPDYCVLENVLMIKDLKKRDVPSVLVPCLDLGIRQSHPLRQINTVLDGQILLAFEGGF